MTKGIHSFFKVGIISTYFINSLKHTRYMTMPMPQFDLNQMIPQSPMGMDEEVYDSVMGDEMMAAEQEADAIISRYNIGDGDTVGPTNIGGPDEGMGEEENAIDFAEGSDQEQLTQALAMQAAQQQGLDDQFQQRNEISNRQNRLQHLRGNME